MSGEIRLQLNNNLADFQSESVGGLMKASGRARAIEKGSKARSGWLD